MFSSLKQVILVQTRQNGYQTVPFDVYIHNLMFVFISDKVILKQPRCGCLAYVSAIPYVLPYARVV